MNTELLRHLGNIEQVAGIREARLLHGRGEDVQVAEFYNAAGLRFTVVPDRCMDLYDLSYKGVNLSFQTKNGLVSPQAVSPSRGEFAEQWSGGALVTCGLGNVGGQAGQGGTFPTHSRIGSVPAKTFGTETFWDGERYILRASGEIHQTRLYSRHLSIRRTVETELNSKTIRLHDVITNFEAEDEPFMLLYHCNFGYPLLQADSLVKVSEATVLPQNAMSTDPEHMLPPMDGRGEELYLRTDFGSGRAGGVLYNERLELGVYVRFDTSTLPNMLEWKNMKSHDYVLALEPCNTCCLNRDEAREAGKIAVLGAYSSIETDVELGVLDGLSEIRSFLKNL